MVIERPDQAWATDITYIPMKRGFLFLVVVMDWFSRFVLAWQLSNSLDTAFCVEALEEALLVSTPEIFNSDQGCQFTSDAFTSNTAPPHSSTHTLTGWPMQADGPWTAASA